MKKTSAFEFELMEIARPALMIDNAKFMRNGPASKNHDILNNPIGI